VQAFEAASWLPLESLDDYWRMTLAALQGRLNGFEPPGPETAPGVFAGVHASIGAKARLEGPIWVGPGAVIEDGASVDGPCWIGANARIESGARVSRSIVEEQSRLAPGARLADQLVLGNRAVDRAGRIRFLEPHEIGWSVEDVAPPVDQSAVQAGLLKLATRVARRGVPLFR